MTNKEKVRLAFPQAYAEPHGNGTVKIFSRLCHGKLLAIGRSAGEAWANALVQHEVVAAIRQHEQDLRKITYWLKANPMGQIKTWLFRGHILTLLRETGEELQLSREELWQRGILVH